MTKEAKTTLLDKLKGTMTVSASKEKLALITSFLTAKTLSFDNISELFFYLLDFASKCIYTPEQIKEIQDKATYFEEGFIKLQEKAAGLEVQVKNLDKLRFESQEGLNVALLANNKLNLQLDELKAAPTGVNLSTIIDYPIVRDFVVPKIREAAGNPELEVTDEMIALTMVNAFAKDIKKSANGTA